MCIDITLPSHLEFQPMTILLATAIQQNHALTSCELSLLQPLALPPHKPIYLSSII